MVMIFIADTNAMRRSTESVKVKSRQMLGVLFLASLAACGSGDEGHGPAPLSQPAVPQTGTPQSVGPQAASPQSVMPVPQQVPQATGLSPNSVQMDDGATPVATAGTPGDVSPDNVSGAGFCDVMSVLGEHCTACHDGKNTAGAPMALLTHDDLHASAISDASKPVYALVAARVRDPMRPMPPQGMLSGEQLASLDAWVAAGAPVGDDPTCSGSMPTAVEERPWPDNCDATYTILTSDNGGPQTVAPGAETHPQIRVDPPWGTDEVQAIAWRAITDNPRVLHHWILYGPSGEFLFGWAPGKDRNEELPPDVGVYLPTRPMRMDVHYNNLGNATAEADASGVEICVLKRENFRPKTATVTNALTSFLINIPPNSGGHEVTATCTHSGEPVRLLSASPHAHRLAKHMTFTLEKANGETIVMHDGPFNFEEQTTYAMEPPVVVESGDRIVTTCTFDNDTSRVVTFGENTGDEMCFNFALYEPMGGLRCGPGGFGGLGRGGFGGFGQ